MLSYSHVATVAITAAFIAFENPEAYPREIGWGCFHPFGQPFGAVGSISKAAKQGCVTPSGWLVSKTWYIFLLVQRLIIVGYIMLHPDGSWLCMCITFTCGVLYLHSMKDLHCTIICVRKNEYIYIYRIHWTWLEAEGCEKQDLCEWHHSCNTRACRSSWPRPRSWQNWPWAKNQSRWRRAAERSCDASQVSWVPWQVAGNSPSKTSIKNGKVIEQNGRFSIAMFECKKIQPLIDRGESDKYGYYMNWVAWPSKYTE